MLVEWVVLAGLIGAVGQRQVAVEGLPAADLKCPRESTCCLDDAVR